MTTEIAVAGEYIPAGTSVAIMPNGKVYADSGRVGTARKYVGEAVDTIREGFRVAIKDGEVREDGA